MERAGLYKNARPWILCLVILCVLLSEHVAIGEKKPTVPKTIHYDYIDEKGELKVN